MEGELEPIKGGVVEEEGFTNYIRSLMDETEKMGCHKCKCPCYKENMKRKKKEIPLKPRKWRKTKNFACYYCNEVFDTHRKRNNHVMDSHASQDVLRICILPGKSFDLDQDCILKDSIKVFKSESSREKLQEDLKKLNKLVSIKKDQEFLPFKLPKNCSGVELLTYNESNVKRIIELVKSVDPNRKVEFVVFKDSDEGFVLD